MRCCATSSDSTAFSLVDVLASSRNHARLLARRASARHNMLRCITACLGSSMHRKTSLLCAQRMLVQPGVLSLHDFSRTNEPVACALHANQPHSEDDR